MVLHLEESAAMEWEFMVNLLGINYEKT